MIQVRRYVAPSYAEALIQAKNELGTDALIVDSKKIRVGGFLGLFQKTMTELTVAVDNTAGPVPAPKAISSSRQGQLAVPVARPAAPTPSAPVRPPAAALPPAGGLAPAAPGSLGAARVPVAATMTSRNQGPSPGQDVAPTATADALKEEIVSIRSMVSQLVGQEEERAALQRLTPYGKQVYETLLERGVEREAALDLALRLPDGPQGRTQLQAEIGRVLGPFQPTALIPGQRRVAALVGPTGAGKTTTLAKLAAHFTLTKGQKVGLVTSDTFRIAAIEQLRTFGDILGIPLHAVDTPAEMAEALQETAECDVVLVDTGGRSHKDPARMQELREILAVLRPDETHLVVPLTSNPRDAFEWLEAYGPLGVNRLLFTKLDEAATPGLMLNMRLRSSYPLGYVTNGQSVPDDLLPADQADFAHILLGA